ncbi:MAG: T9SS type A sorting domain-containing protein [Flavobacteriales bacterium]|nr:T9SS type A sorting domain-containing protein [Flavobacteriales bacterium]
MKEEKSRRQFLRNTALATLSAVILPDLLKANNSLQSQNSIVCNPTTLDYYGQGPFYTAGAPVIINNQLALTSEPGTRLILSGIVQTLDCTAVIPNTIIDIWHANDASQYDNTGFNLRGITESNTAGFYLFETILPGKYLNGTTYRPRHIHLKITPQGFPTLITQLYFQGDTDIAGDAAASISSGTYDATHRIIPITLNGQGKYEGTWDIVVNGSTTGIDNLRLDKGIIYSVFPNPFTDTLEINYGIYQAAKATIQVFDMNGSLVAILDEHNLKPEKYKAIWKPNTDLSAGVYFVTLKINDLQVHYLKVMKV